MPTLEAVQRPAAQALSALAGVPVALNASLDLGDVLRELIKVSLAVSHADRCSIFLLRDGRWLEPTVAVAQETDGELWSRFRSLGPVELPLEVAIHADLIDGRAVPIPCARESVAIPRVWTDTFDLCSLVLVPLLASGAFCGLLVVDYQQPHESTTEELTSLELLSSYAGLAVRNAQLYDEERRRARLHECLSRSAVELVSGRDAADVCRAVADAFRTMLQADVSGIVLIEGERQLTVISGDERSGDIALGDIPAELLAEVAERGSTCLEPFIPTASAWLSDVVGLDDAHATNVLVPLLFEGRVLGVVYLGFVGRRQLDTDEIAGSQGLAAIASAALDRARLVTTLQGQVLRLETLNRLSQVVAQACEPARFRRKLNALLADVGCRVEAIELSDRRIARRLNWPARTAPESDDETQATAVVPLRVGRRAIGALRVDPRSDPTDPFLEAVAAGVAESLSLGAAQLALRESIRDKALAEERQRISHDLHDAVGQVFVATMLLAMRAAEELPRDSEWSARFSRIAELANDGKWSLDQAVRALAFVPETRAGLPAALRALCHSVSEDSGLRVLFSTRGSVHPLPVTVERALYRVGHQALSNTWRHARALFVGVVMIFDDESVRLQVRDDGVGLPLRPDGALRGMGFTGMRRALVEVGGRLTVTSAVPTGIVVEAIVPRRACGQMS